MEAAGADAIEINILKIATVLDEKPGEYEKLHTDILKAIKEEDVTPTVMLAHTKAIR
jgi:dihydroorotate dehydrogenase (fumarate)